MSQLNTRFLQDDAVIDTKISDLAVIGSHLAASAKQAVLESKTFAIRDALLGIAVDVSVASDIVTVTSEVSACLSLHANEATFNDPATVSDGSEKGAYVGTLSVPHKADPKKVFVRQTGTDEGILDTYGQEIHGVLAYAAGEYTVSFEDSNSDPYDFPADDFVDLYIVEYVDLYHVNPADLLLLGGVSGVIDATSASAISAMVSELVSDLTADVVTVSNTLSTSVSSLQSTDTAISNALSTEISSLESTDTAISNALSTSVSSLESTDTAISNALSNTISDVAVVSNTLSTSVSSLESTDTAISNALSDSVSSLESTDVLISDALSNTISDVAVVSNTLSTSVSSLESTDTAISNALSTSVSSLESTDVLISNTLSNTVSNLYSSIASDVALLVASDTEIATACQELIAAEADARVSDVSALQSTIAGLSGAPNSERVALTSTMISDMYVSLSDVANASYLEASSLFVKNGLPQMYPDDYVFSTLLSANDCISWSGLGLDGVLAISDIIRISYYK